MTVQFIKHKCKYKEAFNNKHTPMLIIDLMDGSIDDANPAAYNYYSYSRKKLLSMNISDINSLTRKDILSEIDQAKLENRKFYRLKHKLSNGEIRDVEVYSGPLKVQNRNLLFSVVHDIKEKKELGENYKIKEAYFDSLFNNSSEAIAITDIEFKILNINKSFEDVFQYSLDEIKNKDITEMIVQQDLYYKSYHFREAVSKGKFIKEKVKRKRKDGSLLDVLLLIFPLVVEGKTMGMYCIYTDISESIEKEQQIQMLLSKDTLTGLFNKESFLEILENDLIDYDNKYDNKKSAILILGINELDEINDALGHLSGEEIIKAFAIRLKENLREQDTIARYSEDEFAIIMHDIESITELNKISLRIFDDLNTIYYIKNHELQVTVSMGMSIYPDDGTEFIALVRKADIAMHRSKEIKAYGATRFDITQDLEFKEYFWMKNDLAKAITNGEFFLHFQPIYDTNTNKLVGTEALIRWNYKGNGIIPPLKFIPIAEETGLIHPIGEWVLLSACNQNKKWQDLGYEPIYISVNVSVLQLEEPSFYEIVKRVLKESQLDPKYLQLEITETFFTKNYELIEGAIKELSRWGIRFAIDDFGTGYSSLGQLAELNINNLKIDRTFIDGVDENINKGKIVKAVISLAESLDILLTAEGVETQEELEFLTENRCTIAQGYLFSRPIEAYKVEDLLVRH